jgi:hypothetical protein
MLSVLCMLVGLQMLLAFIAYDVANVPRRPIHPDLPGRRGSSEAPGGPGPGEGASP